MNIHKGLHVFKRNFQIIERSIATVTDGRMDVIRRDDDHVLFQKFPAVFPHSHRTIHMVSHQHFQRLCIMKRNDFITGEVLDLYRMRRVR